MFKRFVSFKNNVLFVLLLPYILCARQIDTFYGPIDVQEPVLLELIDNPIFQRLKNIHQYGVAYYTTHREEYNRYDHSIGVFAILRANNASIEEQIAGLLHDVSHTAFSHVGDWVFNKQNQDKDYHSDIHSRFLEESGLAAILKKYHFTPEQMLPRKELFPALENPLPNLCADRIDYNIQGAYYQGFITHEEAISIFKDIHFINNQWISSNPELIKKLTRFSYGRKIPLGVCAHSYFSIVDTVNEADFIVKSKFRGIDPWVLSESKHVRITELDDKLAEEYKEAKQLIGKGWLIKVCSN